MLPARQSSSSMRRLQDPCNPLTQLSIQPLACGVPPMVLSTGKPNLPLAASGSCGKRGHLRLFCHATTITMVCTKVLYYCLRLASIIPGALQLFHKPHRHASECTPAMPASAPSAHVAHLRIGQVHAGELTPQRRLVAAAAEVKVLHDDARAARRVGRQVAVVIHSRDPQRVRVCVPQHRSSPEVNKAR